MKVNSYEDWCRHYSGLMDDVCKAGVNYSTVHDGSLPGLDGYPCFKHNGCSERCASASFLTPEEVAEKMKESGEALKRYLDNMAHDICPFCGKSIEDRKQIGRCVYALPCYCRLYQGTLPKKEKSIMDHPFFREQRGE
jgi:hypothetical protein